MVTPAVFASMERRSGMANVRSSTATGGTMAPIAEEKLQKATEAALAGKFRGLVWLPLAVLS